VDPALVEGTRAADQQAALLRVATLVAEGAPEAVIAAAVTSEIGLLFEAERANTMRLDGDHLRVIGSWHADGSSEAVGLVLAFGGDTISARVVATSAPARIDSAADLQTEFGRLRWAEFGLQASIGAPIVVDGAVWGVVTASRTQPGDPFPPGAEVRLRDFAALIAQAVVNVEARREMAELVDEQSALRRIATLVAGGRPQAEVLDEVTSEAGRLFGASAVTLVQWQGVQDEVVVIASWTAEGTAPIEPGSRYHPQPGGATLTVLETGTATQSEEESPERGPCSVIAAPVITKASLLGALTASRPSDDAFRSGAAVRLRSFADLAAQSIANERAQAELRASRARIVRTADETRRRLERDLHDGAQQRLVALSLALRMAESALDDDPGRTRELLADATRELTVALEELREIARGIHPAILTGRGLRAALEALAERAAVPVELDLELEDRLPETVEAAGYYVVSESLTNVAKHAQSSRATVRARSDGDVVQIEVVDDGVGGADADGGSGIRGLGDRVEALGGRFGLDSPPGEGTRVWARIPLSATQPYG